MGKPIRITEEHLKEIRSEFEFALQKLKIANGRLNYTKSFRGDERKTTVYFRASAWAKMVALIMAFATEVTWHGLVRRYKDGFVINDIIVPPQEVSGAAFDSDQKEYQDWLMNHDDETFNLIRMHGHSHVNMGVTYSLVDHIYQEKILRLLPDTAFYIFMVWNKKFESNTKVYDLATNTLYENEDIDIRLLDSDESLTEFIAHAKSMVIEAPKAYAESLSGKFRVKRGYDFEDECDYERWGI